MRSWRSCWMTAGYSLSMFLTAPQRFALFLHQLKKKNNLNLLVWSLHLERVDHLILRQLLFSCSPPALTNRNTFQLSSFLQYICQYGPCCHSRAHHKLPLDSIQGKEIVSVRNNTRRKTISNTNSTSVHTRGQIDLVVSAVLLKHLQSLHSASPQVITPQVGLVLICTRTKVRIA